MSQTPKLLVNQGQKITEGIFVALLPVLQQLGYLTAGIVGHVSHCPFLECFRVYSCVWRSSTCILSALYRSILTGRALCQRPFLGRISAIRGPGTFVREIILTCDEAIGSRIPPFCVWTRKSGVCAVSE